MGLGLVARAPRFVPHVRGVAGSVSGVRRPPAGCRGRRPSRPCSPTPARCPRRCGAGVRRGPGRRRRPRPYGTTASDRRCPAPRGSLRRSRSDGWSRRASPARCVRRQRGGRCCSPTGARRVFQGLGNIRVGSCVCTLHDGAAADNTLISAVSVTLTCGSVGLPMREEPPLSAARAYRGATARSDVRVPQLPASGPGHSPRRVSARGEWHGRSESRPS